MIQPLGTNVVLQKDKPESQTKSGLYIPENAQEQPVTAKVVAYGDVDTLDVGALVIYKAYSTTDITFDGEDYLLVDIKDILAIVKEEKK